jgi:hypothetical protein
MTARWDYGARIAVVKVAEQSSWDRTAGTGQEGQDSHGRTADGQMAQDNSD